MARVPLMADYGCLAIPGVICGFSVLKLALWLTWAVDRENGSKEPRQRDPRPEVHAGVMNAMTIAEVHRRLQRLGIGKFPIYSYREDPILRPGLPIFDLVAGAARSDHWAIVFVDALFIPGAAAGHFTFTTVLVDPEPAPDPMHYPMQPPQLTFTAYPCAPQDSRQPVFWRCKLMPSNVQAFTAAQMAGLACCCPWYDVCEHEAAWLARHALCERVTLCGLELVSGTLRGQIESVRDHSFKLNRGPDFSIHVTHCEAVHSESCMYMCPAVGKERLFETVYNALDLTPIIPPTDQIERVIWPYTVLVSSLPGDPEDCTFVNCTKDIFMHVLALRRVWDIRPVKPPVAWAAYADLQGLVLPKLDELLSRLAIRLDVTEDIAIDTLRRLMNEERWKEAIPRPEVQAWLQRVVVSKGMMPQPFNPVGHCYGCRRRVKTYRYECKACRAIQVERVERTPVTLDSIAIHMGFFRLVSVLFTPPSFTLKGTDPAGFDYNQASVNVRGRSLTTYRDIMSWVRQQEIIPTVRGRLCGLMFGAAQPVCYPYGEAVTVQAFCVRLGVERLYRFSMQAYHFLLAIMLPVVSVLTPETDATFLSRFSGTKLLKILEARDLYNAGWQTMAVQERWVNTDYPELYPGRVAEPAPPSARSLFRVRERFLRVKMNSITKFEKGYAEDYVPTVGWVDKVTQKPRFICAPEAIVLYLLGRYTHAQTKWLASRFGPQAEMFYAGCASPAELNWWLNDTLAEMGGFVTYCDDITAIDSNHSEQTFAIHEAIRRAQFPGLPEDIELLFRGEAMITVRIKSVFAEVMHVNASGVSDTSYKNSALCLFIRRIAVACIVMPFDQIMRLPDPAGFVDEVNRFVRQAASGDDGILRLPRILMGVDTCSEAAQQRYVDFWALCGFKVKLFVYPEHRWRMATFLAQRPVWNGTAYEWAPEPARRLRKLFWQIDTNHHPFSWGRGVATQLLDQGKCQPVLNTVANWYLARTSGPVLRVPLELHNPMSTFVSSGELTDRGLEEFYLDYHLDAHALSVFRSLLYGSPTVTICVNCHLVDRVMAEES